MHEFCFLQVMSVKITMGLMLRSSAQQPIVMLLILQLVLHCISKHIAERPAIHAHD